MAEPHLDASEPDFTAAGRAPGDLPLPGDDDREQAPGEGVPLPPPPSLGRQVAQLVIIPAVIVIMCVGLAMLFGVLAGSDQTVYSYVDTLRQSGGMASGPLDVHTPRYQERGRAAYNIATMIPGIKEPAARKELSDRLIEVLDRNVHPDETHLQQYLLIAIGQLGQAGGLEAIVPKLKDGRPVVVEGAIHGLLAWPDRAETRLAVPAVAEALQNAENPIVQAIAATALGELATGDDSQAVAALREASSSLGIELREARWNAEMALAKLGDEDGIHFVCNVLLNREALAKMPAGDLSRDPDAMLPKAAQDRVMLGALASVAHMTNPAIWDKIADLADNDGGAVGLAARKLVEQKKASE